MENPDSTLAVDGISTEKVSQLTELIAKLDIKNSKADVVQNMFMLLGEKVLKQSLDQFYTPITIGKFFAECIAEGVSILEPACGTGDLITPCDTATRYEFRDISKEACDLLELNLKMRGFDKEKYVVRNTNSLCYDSTTKFAVVATNPPFGSRTVEDDPNILRRYELGKNKKKEQLGKLFIECSLNQLEENGILFIVIPTGYLTNTTDAPLRRFLFDNYRVLGVLELPDNTFKRSGTGVDSAVLIVQNTKTDADYPIFIEKIGTIGIDTKSKNTPPLYRADADGKPTDVIDNDLVEVAAKLKYFAHENDIPFMKRSETVAPYQSVKKSTIVANGMVLGIKRYLNSYTDIMDRISIRPHFHLCDFAESPPRKQAFDKESTYTYIDISEITDVDYRTTNEMKGWQLPGRATYRVQENDIFLSRLKGKPSFCIVGNDHDTLAVTNGVFVVRVNDEHHRLSFLKYLLSKSFVDQFNALAGGSIMADVKEEDLLKVMAVPLCDETELENMRELVLHIRKVHELKRSMKEAY